MSWMSKDLALDLLAILIGATQNAYDTIKNAPDAGWPPAVEQPTNETAKQQALAEPPAAEQQQEEAPKQDTPPAAQPQTNTPAPDADDRIVEAKTLLQPISRNGGRDWIKTTLLPQFGVDKLSDVPADKLPQLIEVVKRKQQEMGL